MQLLRASRLGILSFHHGDTRSTERAPEFWGALSRRAKTGFIIQRLTEELDAGEVLVRGYFGTRRYYSLNQAHVYKKALWPSEKSPQASRVNGRAAAGGASSGTLLQHAVSRSQSRPMHRLRVANC